MLQLQHAQTAKFKMVTSVSAQQQHLYGMQQQLHALQQLLVQQPQELLMETNVLLIAKTEKSQEMDNANVLKELSSMHQQTNVSPTVKREWEFQTLTHLNAHHAKMDSTTVEEKEDAENAQEDTKAQLTRVSANHALQITSAGSTPAMSSKHSTVLHATNWLQKINKHVFSAHKDNSSTPPKFASTAQLEPHQAQPL